MVVRYVAMSSSPAVGEFVAGLYGGMNGTRYRSDIQGSTAIADYVPPGWAAQRSFYLDVVKKDCALCHLAGPPHLSFLSFADMLAQKDLVYAAVCTSHSMPHAETSFMNFWGSAAVDVPGSFAQTLGFGGCGPVTLAPGSLNLRGRGR